ncbi:MAG: MFS transporter, partial [Angelakisella sp.]
VVPAVRILYFITFIMMTCKFVILFKYSTETQRGILRRQETKNTSMFGMLRGYKSVLLKLLKTPATMVVLTLKVLINITQMVNSNFFSLYITRGLGIPPNLVAIFPMMRAAVMLLFIFTVQHRVNQLKFRPIMITGGLLYMLANIMLLLTSGTSLWLLIFYVLLDAFSYALLIPRQDSLMVVFVDQEERARTLGLMFVITLGISAPFGALVGGLSEFSIRLPFVLNAVAFGLIVLLVLVSGALKKHDAGDALPKA